MSKLKKACILLVAIFGSTCTQQGFSTSYTFPLIGAFARRNAVCIYRVETMSGTALQIRR